MFCIFIDKTNTIDGKKINYQYPLKNKFRPGIYNQSNNKQNRTDNQFQTQTTKSNTINNTSTNKTPNKIRRFFNIYTFTIDLFRVLC